MGLGEGTPPVRAQFSVEYRAVEAETRQRFKFEFTVADYRVSVGRVFWGAVIAGNIAVRHFEAHQTPKR